MVNSFDVHIVSHYREDRSRQLSLVLDAVLDWKNCLVRAVITSNTDQYETSGFMAGYTDRFRRLGHDLRLNVVDDLKNPRMLTWAHKAFIAPWLEHASPGEDYFLYIEDDLVVTNDNLVYFIRNKDRLAKSGLIPGFIRYETKGDEIRVVDITRPEYWQHDRTTVIDGVTYHANINPYWAGFLLDKRMAQEYVTSRSFDPATSEFVHWNIQERSAMGLTFENPPPKMKSRLVVPIIDGRPDPGSLIWHCSNSYSGQDHPVVAKLTIEQAFLKEALPSFALRKMQRAAQTLTGRS